jgi:hypothetical protein
VQVADHYSYRQSPIPSRPTHTDAADLPDGLGLGLVPTDTDTGTEGAGAGSDPGTDADADGAGSCTPAGALDRRCPDPGDGRTTTPIVTIGVDGVGCVAGAASRCR